MLIMKRLENPHYFFFLVDVYINIKNIHYTEEKRLFSFSLFFRFRFFYNPFLQLFAFLSHYFWNFNF